MQTDLPLKLLTTMGAADLLPLLGIPAAEVLEVVVRELPMKKRALDTLLRVRSPQGQEYLHLLEWQGYPDPSVLWRVLGYLSLVGQEEPHTTIVGTVVYLTPADDQGDTLTMVVDGHEQHRWSVHCIRLWEQDAQAALDAGNLALTGSQPADGRGGCAIDGGCGAACADRCPTDAAGGLAGHSGSIRGTIARTGAISADRAKGATDERRFNRLSGAGDRRRTRNTVAGPARARAAGVGSRAPGTRGRTPGLGSRASGTRSRASGAFAK